MRRIINSTYVSLDGVVTNPQHWPSLPDPGDEKATIQQELIEQCDAVLLGKDTYLGFAGVWQGHSGDAFTDRINTMQKYVVSTTLRETTWDNTAIIANDVAAGIARIKVQPGKDILTYGFGRLAGTLMENGLLDEIRLWIHPFFLGNAPEAGLLIHHTDAARLRLSGSRTMANGTVIHSYAVENGS
ncbi:dihydrofolate reductase family protein [Paeniglutamicibacter sulfureus]|uniref:Dihydrofolate reductase n=1 Tax=Paeniglutamicibacter sulfureus TaxID=43666 RepID=A0ABU2BD85_9MICC|nr:dihydrofolate reductase family protein [Paeniglutamicibacter sulfureus]MDR7356560.1 dihydrofolate reductase [Paeniglutamicibacter sulfureus]